MTRPHAEPRDVFHENGEVIIDGPNGTVIAMTPKPRYGRRGGSTKPRSTS